MNTFIVWHKKNIKWWKKKLNVSDYGVAWIAFIKGLIIGLLIYHFFISCADLRSEISYGVFLMKKLFLYVFLFLMFCN